MELIGGRVDNLTEEGHGYLFTHASLHILSSMVKEGRPKYLAYTNQEVNRINAIVRLKLYTNPNKIEFGEELILDGAWGKNWHSNQAVRVGSFTIEEDKVSFDFKEYVFKVYDIR
jgi:hypothetical protein